MISNTDPLFSYCISLSDTITQLLPKSSKSRYDWFSKENVSNDTYDMSLLQFTPSRLETAYWLFKSRDNRSRINRINGTRLIMIFAANFARLFTLMMFNDVTEWKFTSVVSYLFSAALWLLPSHWHRAPYLLHFTHAEDAFTKNCVRWSSNECDIIPNSDYVQYLTNV